MVKRNKHDAKDRVAEAMSMNALELDLSGMQFFTVSKIGRLRLTLVFQG
jgi:hypothetical protein